MDQKTNTVYLYLHRILLLKSNNNIIRRKRALTIIGNYFRFISPVKVAVLEDMIKLNLVERIDKQKIKVVNTNASIMIDSDMIKAILQSGDKIIDDKAYWDSIDYENEKLREIIREFQKGIRKLEENFNKSFEDLKDKLVLPDNDN